MILTAFPGVVNASAISAREHPGIAFFLLAILFIAVIIAVFVAVATPGIRNALTRFFAPEFVRFACGRNCSIDLAI